MADEELWRRRFLSFMALRLLGVAAFLAGIAIAFSDLVREGGWPEVGALLAIAGGLEAVLIPRVLKRIWERQDR